MKHIKNINDFISEVIKVPIKVGDIIYGGRFKNKKVLVKKIGKNDKGDITINGKPLLKFRIIKESVSKLEEDVNSYLAHLIDNGFTINVTENDLHSDEDNAFKRYFIKIFKETEFHKYTYSNKDFNWSEIEEEVMRFISMILDEWDFDVEYTYSMVKKVTTSENNTKVLSLDRIMIPVEKIIDGSSTLSIINSFTIGIIGGGSVNESMESPTITLGSKKDDLLDLFQDLKDDGFKVFCNLRKSPIVNFPKSNSLIPGGTIGEYSKSSEYGLEIKIDKRGKLGDSLGYIPFKSSDLIEALLFAESYAKDELGLVIRHIRIEKIPFIDNYVESTTAFHNLIVKNYKDDIDILIISFELK